jgi:hypothetical protein
MLCRDFQKDLSVSLLRFQIKRFKLLSGQFSMRHMPLPTLLIHEQFKLVNWPTRYRMRELERMKDVLSQYDKKLAWQ